jgi:cyclopropane-fatty-acyl-phospholipid synthase
MNAVANMLVKPTIELMERGLMPDFVIRQGIRRLLKERLRNLQSELKQSGQSREQFNQQFFQRLWSGPVAVDTDKANQQHYEVPADFYDLVLGPNKKYSCCFFDSAAGDNSADLEQAEKNSLNLTCQHAQLVNGNSILELGCGWGSLTLWMARHFPDSQITAVSNSHSQQRYISAQAEQRGLSRQIQVVTCDINLFVPKQKFDRIVSVEMFEHVRNHRTLMNRIADWLEPEGRLFVHIFCHRDFCYPFETEGASNWMGQYFFTGGIMPNQELLPAAAERLQTLKQWIWNGRHYEKTSNLWAANMDRHKETILRQFEKVYGPGQGLRWFYRWKIFFLACAELFGTREGNEWFVQHTLFSRK